MAIGFRFRNGLGALPPISDVMYYNIRNMSYNDDRLTTAYAPNSTLCQTYNHDLERMRMVPKEIYTLRLGVMPTKH